MIFNQWEVWTGFGAGFIVVELLWRSFLKQNPKRSLLSRIFLGKMPGFMAFLVYSVIVAAVFLISVAAINQKTLAEDLNSLSNDLFAAIQAGKIKQMYTTMEDTTNPMEITSLSRLAIVTKGYASCTDLWEINTGELTEFVVRFSFGRPHNLSTDGYQVLVQDITESVPEVRVWDTLHTVKPVVRDSSNVFLQIPVNPKRRLIVRVDSHKAGWSEESPISLTGIDVREFERPPETINLWARFADEPKDISAIGLRYSDVFSNSPGTDTTLKVLVLHDSLLDKESSIYLSSNMDQFDEPFDWKSWGFKPGADEYIEDKLPYLYHYEFDLGLGANSYGFSFWQHNFDLRLARELVSAL